MKTNRPSPQQRAVAAGVCAALLIALLLILNWHQGVVAKREASERIAAAALSQREDLALFGSLQAQEQVSYDAEVAQQRIALADEVRTELKQATKVVDGYQGELEHQEDFEKFRDRLKDLTDDIEGSVSIHTLERLRVETMKITKSAKASNKAYQAEQVRLAEEKRRAEAEAARQREAVQVQAQPESSSGAGTALTTTSAPAGKGYHAEIKSLLATYGCSGAGVSTTDPRLGQNRGKADWFNNTVLIRPGLTGESLRYVVAHECAHLRQYRAYDGDVGSLEVEMNQIYGGSDFGGLEQNADCIVQRMGVRASYIYTRDCSGARGSAAAAVLAGGRP